MTALAYQREPWFALLDERARQPVTPRKRTGTQTPLLSIERDNKNGCFT